MALKTDALMDAIAAEMTARLEVIGERIAQHAREKAPVGHGERQGKAEAIVPRQSSKGLSAAQAKQLTSILAGELPETVFSKAIANRRHGQTIGEAQHEFAKLFRFKTGGGTPERVEIRKTILRGFRRTKPHLRDTIRSEGVTREGNVLHLTVAARSDHAMQVEKGFHHKGGQQIAGRPFLYPAWDAEREGLASGRSLKG